MFENPWVIEIIIENQNKIDFILQDNHTFVKFKLPISAVLFWGRPRFSKNICRPENFRR